MSFILCSMHDSTALCMPAMGFVALKLIPTQSRTRGVLKTLENKFPLVSYKHIIVSEGKLVRLQRQNTGNSKTLT